MFQTNRRTHFQTVLAIVACLLALGVTSGCENKPKLSSDGDLVSPPPGYPNSFPFNSKRWQEGKIPVQPGMPPPPSMGGTPPPGLPPAAPAK